MSWRPQMAPRSTSGCFSHTCHQSHGDLNYLRSESSGNLVDLPCGGRRRPPDPCFIPKQRALLLGGCSSHACRHAHRTFFASRTRATQGLLKEGSLLCRHAASSGCGAGGHTPTDGSESGREQLRKAYVHWDCFSGACRRSKALGSLCHIVANGCRLREARNWASRCGWPLSKAALPRCAGGLAPQAAAPLFLTRLCPLSLIRLPHRFAASHTTAASAAGGRGCRWARTLPRHH